MVVLRIEDHAQYALRHFEPPETAVVEYACPHFPPRASRFDVATEPMPRKTTCGERSRKNESAGQDNWKNLTSCLTQGSMLACLGSIPVAGMFVHVSELIHALQTRMTESGDSEVLMQEGPTNWRSVGTCQARMLFALAGDNGIFVALQDVGDRLETGKAVLAVTLQLAAFHPATPTSVVGATRPAAAKGQEVVA